MGAACGGGCSRSRLSTTDVSRQPNANANAHNPTTNTTPDTTALPSSTDAPPVSARLLRTRPRTFPRRTLRLLLRRTRLGRTGLRRPTRGGTHLGRVLLRGTALHRTRLGRTRLGRSHGFRAHPCGTRLCRTRLRRAHLGRTHLSRTRLPRTRLDRAHLSRTHLSRVHVGRVHLGRTHLLRSHLPGACLPGACLPIAYLPGGRLRRGRLLGNQVRHPVRRLVQRDPGRRDLRRHRLAQLTQRIRLLLDLGSPPRRLTHRELDQERRPRLDQLLLLREVPLGLVPLPGHGQLEEVLRLGPLGVGLGLQPTTPLLGLPHQPLTLPLGLHHGGGALGSDLLRACLEVRLDLHLTAFQVDFVLLQLGGPTVGGLTLLTGAGIGLGAPLRQLVLHPAPVLRHLGLGALTQGRDIALGTQAQVVRLLLGHHEHPVHALAGARGRAGRHLQPLDPGPGVLQVAPGHLQQLAQVGRLGQRLGAVEAEVLELFFEVLQVLDHLTPVESPVDHVETRVQRNNLRLFRTHGGPTRLKIGRGAERKAPERLVTTLDYPLRTPSMRAAGSGNTYGEDLLRIAGRHPIVLFGQRNPPKKNACRDNHQPSAIHKFTRNSDVSVGGRCLPVSNEELGWSGDRRAAAPHR
ncbi:pentapeptide repeat-containing protein [Saccharothrix ecbatanensis]|uniref:pentapeptide repeat-containing protein n=1 Tax=Saccharothrix ecbatanensis TaxID=1105145 RepID=UPI0035E45F10